MVNDCFTHPCHARAMKVRMGAMNGSARPRLSPEAIVFAAEELIRGAVHTRELARPSMGPAEAARLARIQWIQLHGFAALRLSGLLGTRPDDIELGLLINLLGLAGFTVAATPAGLEAAAVAAAADAPPGTLPDVRKASGSPAA